MLVSAAVCPHPPALVPRVSSGAADILAAARGACVRAVEAVAAARPDVVVCVGPGPQTRQWGAEAGGSMRDFGVHASYGGRELVLPASLTVAAYLLQEAGVTRPTRFQAVAESSPPQDCAALGAALAEQEGRVGLVVMGDGSAKRGETSPGYVDDRAEPFDTGVVAALAACDVEALLAVDPGLASELWAAGRPSWQVLAGALRHAAAAMRAEVLYDAAPLGVGYVVVQLSRDRQG